MSLLTEPEAEPVTEAEKEALIKEARRLRRRRWFLGAAAVGLAIGAGIGGFLIASGPPPVSHNAAPAGSSGAPRSSASARAFVPTRSPDLIQPTTLATLPDGDVLILDSSRDEILELKPNGDLSVFAGTGRLGFSGDGGPARDADLRLGYFSAAGMTVTPDGSVDLVDNCRVRQITPNGTIHSVLRLPRVKVSQHRTGCPVSGLAVSPAGRIYIATSSLIERATAAGQLVWVAGSRGPAAAEPPHPTRSNVALDPDALAFNRAGDLFIASFGLKLVYELTLTGELIDLGESYADQFALAPDGEILVGTHSGLIQEIGTSGITPFLAVVPKRTGINWPEQGFQEDGIAVTKTGTIYVDNAQGNGYGDGTVLVRITPGKRASLASIRTPLAATLPKPGAPGFPISVFPAARPSRGSGFTSCPSDQGLQPFTAAAITQARRIAKTYRSNQFASDIAVTDRSWWTADFNAMAAGGGFGRHTITGETPTSRSPVSADLAAACGQQLVADSIAIKVGKSGYSDFTGTLYFLDRNGHPLVYDVR